MQLSIAMVTAVFLPRLSGELLQPARQRMVAIPTHNAVQALKGIWRT